MPLKINTNRSERWKMWDRTFQIFSSFLLTVQRCLKCVKGEEPSWRRECLRRMHIAAIKRQKGESWYLAIRNRSTLTFFIYTINLQRLIRNKRKSISSRAADKWTKNRYQPSDSSDRKCTFHFIASSRGLKKCWVSYQTLTIDSAIFSKEGLISLLKLFTLTTFSMLQSAKR